MEINVTYYVYKHTSPSSKVYIGITSQNPPERRWQRGLGYKNQKYFYNAIQKYGWDNFKHEILYSGLSKEEAEKKEIELIAYYNSTDRNYGYNFSNGGNCVGTMLPATKKKISIANKGNQYGVGHIVSKESRSKISIAMIGNQHGQGQKMSDEIKEKLAASHKTDGFRKKLSKINTGKKCSNQTKKKISQSCKGLGCKKVICVETGMIYDSILEAQKTLSKKSNHISECCQGKRKTAGGYHWKYVETEVI